MSPKSRAWSEFVRAACIGVAAWVVVGSAYARAHIEGDLPRQAELGFQTQASNGELRVSSVSTGSPAEAAGLSQGDVLVAINGEQFARDYLGSALLEASVGNEPLTLSVRRSGGVKEIRFTPAPKPFEEIEGLDSYFGVLKTPDGARLRTIITRPAGSVGRLPAVFVVQWVSCDSVEFNRTGAWLDVYRGVAQRSGYAMIRVERAPNGDSIGPPCHEFDFETELAHYRFAFDRLTQSRHVDSSRVIVMGNSLGSMMAPLVARGKRVAGVTVSSGGALTYFERMLYFDRQFLERGGGRPEDIHDALLRQARFHVEYLLNGKTPEKIAAENPSLGEVWRQIPHTGNGVHYGRPYRYHHQLARANVLGAWAAIQAPVLVIFNEFDQYESRRGGEVIAETLNRLRPGSARFAFFPKVEHSFYLYPSADLAFVRERGRGVAAPEPAIFEILRWLREDVEERAAVREPERHDKNGKLLRLVPSAHAARSARTCPVRDTSVKGVCALKRDDQGGNTP